MGEGEVCIKDHTKNFWGFAEWEKMGVQGHLGVIIGLMFVWGEKSNRRLFRRHC